MNFEFYTHKESAQNVSNNRQILDITEMPFFRRVGSFGQNLAPYIIFSAGELHTVLKHGNLEMCEHLSFSIIDEIMF